MFGSHPVGSGEPEKGQEPWRVNDGGGGLQDGPEDPWVSRGSRQFQWCPLEETTVQRGVGPPGPLTLSAVFFPPDHNF